MLDAQALFNILASSFLAGVGWFAHSLYDSVSRLRENVHNLEVDLPRSYVLKDDLDKRMDHIESMFQRIYDKLDGKADK
jgi:hypothetical protein